MRRLLRKLLLRPVLWASSFFSSRPDKKRIFSSLSGLLQHILRYPGKRGLIIPFKNGSESFIIFSDQHKGRKNGADDFALAEQNFLAALEFYASNNYWFINLGDSEELWENNIWQVKKHNKAAFEAEKKFILNKRYIKIFGNHDLYWDNDPLASWNLKDIYGKRIKVYEGVVLKTLTGHSPLTILLTHGHQGDAQSDGNWFSKFFVANIWAPLQAYLRINPNTPAYDSERKTLHNSIMYEWSSLQNQTLLITGHTHQPVFESLTHLERLYLRLEEARNKDDTTVIAAIEQEIPKRKLQYDYVNQNYRSLKPTYFNTGCCCFSDGTISGIEIENGQIRLVLWKRIDGTYKRIVAEVASI
jgi:predicted phosphodiesterase